MQGAFNLQRRKKRTTKEGLITNGISTPKLNMERWHYDIEKVTGKNKRIGQCWFDVLYCSSFGETLHNGEVTLWGRMNKKIHYIIYLESEKERERYLFCQ